MTPVSSIDRLVKKITFRKIILGDISGENEADFVSNFENYYFNYDNNIQKVVNPKIFYLLGRKGTGKSLLARYLKKQHENSPCHFTDVISYRNFTYHELFEYRDGDFTSKEYLYIFKWSLLINLGRSMLRDNSLSDHKYYDILKRFIEDNFGKALDQKIILESSKKLQIEAGIKGYLKSSYAKESSEQDGCYLDYLKSLENIIIELGKSSDNKYLIFYDDLDDRFGLDPIYLESMRSLLYAVDETNRMFVRNGFDAKSVLIFRSDIFDMMNFPDLTKFKYGNSLILDWHTNDGEHSPIFSMILYKIIKSLNENPESIRYDTLYHKLFTNKISGRISSSYIIERTLCRPRDVIQMLNFIIDEFPNSTYFSPYVFSKTNVKYSRYLLNDIVTEMKGHKDDEFIKNAFSLIKGFGKPTFNIEQIKSRTKYIFTKDVSKGYLEELLNFLYYFGVIGNIYHDAEINTGIIGYSWAHIDGQDSFDITARFSIHLGLRVALKSEKNELTMVFS